MQMIHLLRSLCISRKTSTAEMATLGCHFLKDQAMITGHSAAMSEQAAYTQTTAYQTQKSPWILKLLFKSHWLQVTYIFCLTWNDSVLHYFAGTGSYSLKHLWLPSLWSVKREARPVFIERLQNCWKLRRRGELELEKWKRTESEKKIMSVFKRKNTMGISLKILQKSSQNLARTHTSERRWYI